MKGQIQANCSSTSTTVFGTGHRGGQAGINHSVVTTQICSLSGDHHKGSTMDCGQPPPSHWRGWMGSACPEWTVASGDPLFIGMQNNGRWSVMRGVVGTDLVAEVIMVVWMVCFTMKRS